MTNSTSSHIATQTTAIAYTAEAVEIEDSGPNIDLISQAVEYDGVHEVYRSEADWTNLEASAWGTDAADNALANAGWERTGEWKWAGKDVGGGYVGWKAAVKRIESEG